MGRTATSCPARPEGRARHSPAPRDGRPVSEGEPGAVNPEGWSIPYAPEALKEQTATKDLWAGFGNGLMEEELVF